VLSGADGRARRKSARVIRKLTPAECERLQGFPPGWTMVEGASNAARFKQLGNAVTVNVAEWIAKRAFASLSANRL
jgi:DNA (cytosine-5)-methyltransferase 1